MYAVIYHEETDGHFRPTDDKILFTNENKEECEKYKEEYLETHLPGWWHLIVRKVYL